MSSSLQHKATRSHSSLGLLQIKILLVLYGQTDTMMAFLNEWMNPCDGFKSAATADCILEKWEGPNIKPLFVCFYLQTDDAHKKNRCVETYSDLQGVDKSLSKLVCGQDQLVSSVLEGVILSLLYSLHPLLPSSLFFALSRLDAVCLCATIFSP